MEHDKIESIKAKEILDEFYLKIYPNKSDYEL